MYRPSASLKRRIAPSGIWRGQPVPGDVNDQNAVAMGGVAGHAGVFSTGNGPGAVRARSGSARASGRTGQWVQPRDHAAVSGEGPAERIPAARLGHARDDQPPTSRASSGRSSAMRRTDIPASPGPSSGSIPARDLFLVFLTNRAFDPRVRESAQGAQGRSRQPQRRRGPAGAPRLPAGARGALLTAIAGSELAPLTVQAVRLRA